jgi:hypothetical protein
MEEEPGHRSKNGHSHRVYETCTKLASPTDGEARLLSDFLGCVLRTDIFAPPMLQQPWLQQPWPQQPCPQQLWPQQPWLQQPWPQTPQQPPRQQPQEDESPPGSVRALKKQIRGLLAAQAIPGQQPADLAARAQHIEGLQTDLEERERKFRKHGSW